MNTVTVCGHQLPIVEYQGQRVVTLAMVDEVHERPEGTARKRFNDNRNRFIEAEDFFVRNSDEARQMGITAPNGLTLLTESGYLMLVKSLTDDLAWEVQRQLVRSYFRPAAPAKLSRLELLEMALASEREKLQAIAERDHAIATKALIGGKREATAMATASAATKKARQLEQELGRGTRHATIIAVENVTGLSFGNQGFRPLQKWCKAHDVTPPKVPCPRFGMAGRCVAGGLRRRPGRAVRSGGDGMSKQPHVNTGKFGISNIRKSGHLGIGIAALVVPTSTASMGAGVPRSLIHWKACRMTTQTLHFCGGTEGTRQRLENEKRGATADRRPRAAGSMRAASGCHPAGAEGYISVLVGEFILNQSARAASIRACQPSPVARKASTSWGGSRTVTETLPSDANLAASVASICRTESTKTCTDFSRSVWNCSITFSTLDHLFLVVHVERNDTAKRHMQQPVGYGPDSLKPGVARASRRRYSSPVTVNPVAGRRGPINSRRTSAHHPKAGAFFVPAVSCYGGCAWEGFGPAGFLESRSANLRTAATLNRVAAIRGSSSIPGATPYEARPRPQSVRTPATRRRASRHGPRRPPCKLLSVRSSLPLQRPHGQGPRPGSAGGGPVIAVQLIDSTGRVLGNLRLPAGVRLADLEQLALAAGHQSLPEHIEEHTAAKAHPQAPKAVEVIQ